MNITYRVDVDISPDGPGDDNYCPYANVTVIRGYDSNNRVVFDNTYVNMRPDFFELRAIWTTNAPLAAAFREAAADIAAAYEGQF